MKPRFIIFLALLLLPSVITFAQRVEDVSLVTSASAPTEEKAIMLALRSAIEQTYGSFVSANTSILNDELVRDEVVSVSHGNVKSYEKLSSNVLPNGQTAVTLKSTISISSLVNFAKSKGAQAEFAGQTFSMNIKLMKLKEENALAAYENMCVLAGELLDGAFDYEIDLGEPKVTKENLGASTQSGYLFKVNIKVLATPRTSQIYELITNTLNSIKLSPAEVSDFNKVGMRTLNYSYYYLNYERDDPNAIILPIGAVTPILTMDEALNEKAINAFFNYSLVSLSNEQSFISWQKQCLCQKYSFGTRDIDREGNYYWLVNSYGNAITALTHEGFRERFNGFRHVLHYRHPFYSPFKDDFFFFSDRIDLNTNWDAWKLPKYIKKIPIENNEQLQSDNTKKRRRSKKSTPMKTIEEYSTLKQVIMEYSLPFFVPEEQIASFSGLQVHTPSYTLPFRKASHEEITETMCKFFSIVQDKISTTKVNGYWDLRSSFDYLTFNQQENIICLGGSRLSLNLKLENMEQDWHRLDANRIVCLLDAKDIKSDSNYKIILLEENGRKCVYVMNAGFGHNFSNVWTSFYLSNKRN